MNKLKRINNLAKVSFIAALLTIVSAQVNAQASDEAQASKASVYNTLYAGSSFCDRKPWLCESSSSGKKGKKGKKK